MSKSFVCPRCQYSTDCLGNYNKHVNKYIPCKPKQTEECHLCGKQCKVGGSNLRKHLCVAKEGLEIFDEHSMPVQIAIAQLQALSGRMFKECGFAGPATDVAVAAFNLLYRNSRYLQYHNVSLCQFNPNKLSVVEQRGHFASAQLIWVARPKAEVLDDVLDDVADVLDCIIETMPHKLPKSNMKELQFITKHVLRLIAHCQHPERINWERIWREQNSDKVVPRRIAVCEEICLSMQAQVEQSANLA